LDTRVGGCVICPYVHMSICPYVHMSICPYVHMCICAYVHMSEDLKDLVGDTY
jgi:hypothetical protein